MPSAWCSQLESLLETELRDGSPADPFRVALLRWATETGRDSSPEAVLGSLEESIASGYGARRFRWHVPIGKWIPFERRRRWRSAEAELAERHANEHAGRLWLPLLLVEHMAWLDELAGGSDAGFAARARAIRDEALPTVEDVVAATVGARDTWGDTFLLWAFVRSPRALEQVRGLVLALAARHAAHASRTQGIVRGRTFPFFDLPMPSATAHLGTASTTLGEGLALVDAQLAFLRDARRRDDGWGDPGQGSDMLTTLAAARLLGSIDPSFDPGSAVEPLRALASASGRRPNAIGPEWPWLTAELVRYLRWAPLPFTERFRWPNIAPSAMDNRVGVPRFEGYLALADLFRAIPALCQGEVEVAFIDLANFGAWNTDHGMVLGDELLALLTAHLRTLPESRTFRDGGDEFLVVGAPDADRLRVDLADLFARWPQASRKAFPSLPVVPLRAVISREGASNLRAARERQGVWIGEVKKAHELPPPEGVIVRYEGTGDAH
jgi:GGDEF domain-containing protein